jgi:hypothetical protein
MMPVNDADREAANKAFDVAYSAQGTAEEIEDAMTSVLMAYREAAYQVGRIEGAKAATDKLRALPESSGYIPKFLAALIDRKIAKEAK